jgi:hypothetical protein
MEEEFNANDLVALQMDTYTSPLNKREKHRQEDYIEDNVFE